MQLGNTSAASVATTVWNQPTRQITGLGFALSSFTTTQTTLLPLTIADFRPGTSARTRTITICWSATATTQIATGLYDGTNFTQGQRAGVSASLASITCGNQILGIALNNTDAVNSVTYAAVGYDLVS